MEQCTSVLHRSLGNVRYVAYLDRIEYLLMKRTRAQFKLAVRYCKQHEDTIRSDVNKDLTFKAKDNDKDQTLKVKDQDKD